MSALAIAGLEPAKCRSKIYFRLQAGLREWSETGTTLAAVCRIRAESYHGVTAMVVVLSCWKQMSS